MLCKSENRFTWLGFGLSVVLGLIFSIPLLTTAQMNVMQYSNTLSTSIPSQPSNHTFRFTILTDIEPGGVLRIEPPADFPILHTSTFSAERNVEILVNGVARPSTVVFDPNADLVEIQTGSSGYIQYELASTLAGIQAGDRIELRVGNQTTNSLDEQVFVSTTTNPVTGTTTVATTTVVGDIPGIVNSSNSGSHRIPVHIFDASSNKIAGADFVIFLIEPVGVGPVDTTSDIPPELSEGMPTGTVSGVVSGVEVSVRTNKFAYCRYSTEPDVEFSDMTREFDRGDEFWVFHTFTIVAEQDKEYSFYIRCIDLEDNVNEEDYPIEFRIGKEPTGEENPDGGVEGDGSGTEESEGSGGSLPTDGDGSLEGDGSAEDTDPGVQAGSGGGGGSGSGGGSSGSGGSGAGGGFESTDAPFESGDGRVIINGFAQPNSDVVILVDGTEAQRTSTNNDGRYTVTIDGIARGVYTFGVYGIDRDGTKSSTFSTSFTVSGARTTSLSNINVPPSVTIDPDPVQPGTDVTISGFTVPDSEVILEHKKEGSLASLQTFTINSASNGAWEHVLDTSRFTQGPHKLRVMVKTDDMGSSNFSNHVRYGVGEELGDVINADLNRDGRVNLIDFSILLFWWGTAGGDSDPPADINQDGVVNLIDFSILLFNWTG